MTTEYITLVFHTPHDIVLAEVGGPRNPGRANENLEEMAALMVSHGASRVVILNNDTLEVVVDTF